MAAASAANFGAAAGAAASGTGYIRSTAHGKTVTVWVPHPLNLPSTCAGEGYTVHDLTGHGHDLAMLATPRWVPVETPFAVCGNAIVEGAEQCDDGSRKAGDGCSADCQVLD